MQENIQSQSKQVVEQVDPKVLKIVSTVAVVSIALSLRKLARTNAGALKAANELVRVQKVMLEAYNIAV